MDAFVATKLEEFDNGKISRRKLIEMLTLAATAAPAATPAEAASADPALKVALVNHVSYTCPNFRQAADWYAKLFNLDQVGATQTQIVLPFGKKGEQPYNVPDKDVPLTHLVVRTREQTAPPANGGEPARKSRALVNHIAYTIADFDRPRVLAELKRMGYANPLADGPHSFHIVDPFGFDVQISGIEMTALRD